MDRFITFLKHSVNTLEEQIDTNDRDLVNVHFPTANLL